MRVSELKQLAMLKLQKSMPKTKKELEAFVLGSETKAETKTEVKTTHPDVKQVQEHLKKKACPKVKPEELEGFQSHKEAVEHLKKKKCPETKAVAKKAYVAPSETPAPAPAPAPALTKSGRPKKEYTDEQKEANRERMAKLRAMRGKGKSKEEEPKESYVNQSDYVF